jgi:hypothetical protein
MLPTPEDYDPETPSFDLKRRRLKSGILFSIVLLASGALIISLFGLQPPVQGTERYAAVGDFPPDHVWFNTPEPISLYEDLRGHVVVMLFCEFDRLSDVQDLTGFEALGELYADQPVELIVVYIPSDSSVDSWRTTVADWGIGLPVIVDSDLLVSQNMMADRYPLVQVIDAHGRVAGRYYEAWTTTDLEGVVNDVMMLGQAGRSLSGDPYQNRPGEYIPDSMREVRR